ncbi:MAG TPA: EF-P lysine aminoacylase GenX, partial [Thiomicrospira sp.]|nr:EF-P lysine aminoacylase GenX [Thiomicrospira sp.]
NGYLELQDSAEYLKRFQQDLSQRASQQKTIYPLDENLLEALEKGRLPNCSGVALGFDRLLMLAENKDNIQQVIPFSIVQ